MPSCLNPQCERVVMMDADGSPPAFCSCCGEFLPLSMFDNDCGRSAESDICQFCGKLLIKRPDKQPLKFCPRCGRTKEIELSVTALADGNVLEISEMKLEAALPISNPDCILFTPTRECDTSTSNKTSTTVFDSSCVENQRSIPMKTQQSITNKDFSPISEVIPNRITIEHQPNLHEEDAQLALNDDNSLSTYGLNYDCAKCSRTFKSSRSLKLHLRTCSQPNVPKKNSVDDGVKPVVSIGCSICKKEYASRSAYQDHLNTEICVPNDFWKCRTCEYFTKNREGWKNHELIHLPKRFMCNICSKFYRTAVNLRDHLNIHTGNKPYKCGKCDKTFNNRAQYSHHTRNNCQVIYKKRLCQDCGKYCSDLPTHTRAVHLKLRPFACETCGKAFPNKRKLVEHIRVHTGEKPYKCSFCDFSCKQRGYLTIHMSKCKGKTRKNE